MTERIEPSERRGITNIAGGDGMKDEDQAVFTRERYDKICKRAEELGITIITKYRKGLKNIRVGDIVLEENKPN